MVLAAANLVCLNSPDAARTKYGHGFLFVGLSGAYLPGLLVDHVLGVAVAMVAGFLGVCFLVSGIVRRMRMPPSL